MTEIGSTRPARPWLVWVDGFRQHAETVYGHTRGAAKYLKWLEVSDAWDGLPITKMRCRAIPSAEAPGTPEKVLRVGKARGCPWVRCGHRVQRGADLGTIVGANDSQNWEVLWDLESSLPGVTAPVHPADPALIYLSARDIAAAREAGGESVTLEAR